MAAVSTKMSETGRITVPPGMCAARKASNSGGRSASEVVDGELRVRSVAQAMDRARALTREIMAGRKGLSVDDFLTDRRREAERET